LNILTSSLIVILMSGIIFMALPGVYAKVNLPWSHELQGEVCDTSPTPREFDVEP